MTKAPTESQPQQYQRLLRKHAGSPDQQFEQGFFQLAYDKLQSKLFNLLPYMVGFEVVNKAPDGTKAVGVFGFKSDNGQILYVPAFFINGKVKDLDVMYSRNNNQFYPLNEDFAQLFLKDDVTGMGSVSDQKRQEIEKQTPSSDMRDLVFPPRTGRISYASVIDFIEEGDNTVKAAAWNLLHEHPEFTEAMHRFYSPEKIAAALSPKVKEAAQSSVEVVDAENAPADLKPKAMSKGFATIDRRKDDEKSRYGILSYTDKFTNPTEPGFYSYLTSAGSIRYGLVLLPYSLYVDFKSSYQLVVDLSATQRGQCYCLGEGKKVFIREALKVEDYSAVHKLMENPVEAEASFSKTYVLLNEQLKSVGPFRVTMNYTDQRGQRRLKVEASDRLCGFDLSYAGATRDSRRWDRANQFNPKETDRHSVTLVFTKKEGDSIEYRGNILYIPKGFKLLEVTSSSYYPPYDSADSSEARSAKEETSRKERERVRLGEPGTIQDLTSLLRENGVFPFTARSNGSEYFMTVAHASKKYDNALKAKIGMILDFGLDEADAIELVDGVSDIRPTEGYFKIAVTGDFTHTLQDEPESYNELGQPTTFGIPYHAVAPTDHYYQGDPQQRGLATTQVDQGSWGNSKDEAQNASSMAANGQKEIFDTSAIAMISKYVDPTSKVVSYLPNFVDTLDKLGRMLFMVYWETEKFHKMYGQDDLPELIELIKSVFRNLGDLVIFLKRKFPDISINVSEQDVTEGG